MQMRQLIPCGAAALATLFGAGPALAQSEAPPSLLCATSTVMQCTTAGGCSEVRAAEVDVPAFMQVEFGDENTVSDPNGTDDDVSTIDLIHVVDDQIVLHGTDPGGPGGESGTAWTATISETTGELLVSTTSHGTAFLVFGTCLVDE
jgi:hypothetical protein